MTTASTARQSDIEIQKEVLEELDWDNRVRPNEVGVSVRDGVVTLSGSVDSYAKRWAAQDAAFRVRGVKAVANDLEVVLPSALRRTDAELAEAALNALKWDADVPTEQVEISVSQGWVTLKGTVDLPFQRQQAERAVNRLIGVTGVTNLISVRTHAPVPADIKQRIERALLRNAETDAHRISVEVQGSKVILRGTVRS